MTAAKHIVKKESPAGGRGCRRVIRRQKFCASDPSGGEAVLSGKLNVENVPVDGFWSVSVYNADGYFQPNHYNAYSLNNLTVRKNDDGSIAIQFGACDRKYRTACRL